MNTWKVILATLVIFSAGVVTGNLLAKRSLSHKPGQSAALNHAVVAETQLKPTNSAFNIPGQLVKGTGMRKDFLKDLDCELQLTVEQRGRIEKILCEGQECTKKLWDQVAPQIHHGWVEVKEKIRAELTDEQKFRFEEFMKRPRKPDDKKSVQREEIHPQGEVREPPPSPQCDEQCGNVLLEVLSNSKL